MNTEFWYDFRQHSQSSPLFDADDIARAFGVPEAQFLGRGSFGETWRIQAPEGDYAAKVIHDAQFPRSRLQREVHALERSNTSPSVAALVRIQEVDLAGQVYRCLLFDYIPGGSLATHIRNNHWPNSHELTSFALGILRALRVLHSNGVIHRDIKPDNIVLRDSDFTRPVLLDLGIAKILDLPSLTRYPQPIGTPPFMAPEQIRGERPRKGTDLWSLGVILYLLSTRSHPFYGDFAHRLSEEEAYDRLRSGPPELPKGVDATLATLIVRFLEPEIYKRGTADRSIANIEGDLR